jgi:phage terminase large subunit-like protein
VLRDWQRRFIYRLYELDAAGGRLWRQALWGLPRGNGKTEIAAAIAAYELCGPDRISPVVVVAAASWEQADLVFGALRTMCKESPTLSTVTEPYDVEILRTDRPGRAFRVAAVAGTNEGLRPSAVIADELHEWLGNRERVWTVLTSGAAKRADSLALAITTAGWDRESICYRLYDQGRRIEAGELDPGAFLFEWWEAPEDTSIDDREALAACNPALGDFLLEEQLVQQMRSIPEHEFRRYHRNQWVSAGEAWIPPDRWDALRQDLEVEPKTQIILGFDGSISGDATALIGCTLAGHLFAVGIWDRPPDVAGEWKVPRSEVDAAVDRAFRTWDVLELAADPSWWPSELEDWRSRLERVVDFPQSNVRMGPACQRFYAAVMEGQISHDCNPTLTRHLHNARTKDTRFGVTIDKEYRGSPRKIDAATAAVMAYERASWHAENGRGEPLVAWA